MLSEAPAVRGCGPGDVEALARLEAEVLPHGWDASSLSQELARSDSIVLVAVAPGTAAASAVVGGAVARGVPGEVELLWVGVAPGQRRSGLGRALVDAVVARARARASRVVLEVRVSNEPALALYRGAGFVVAGRRARYYRDGEDALVLANETLPEAPP